MGAMGRARQIVNDTAIPSAARLIRIRRTKPISWKNSGARLVALPRPIMVKTVYMEMALAVFCGDSTLLANVTAAVE